jgi:hypothetical protein
MKLVMTWSRAVAPAQGLMFQPVTPGDKVVLFAFAQLGKPYIWQRPSGL